MSLRTLPGFRHIIWPPFTVVLVVPVPRISLLPFSPVTPLMTGPTGVSLERPQGLRIQMFTNVSIATRIQISIPLFFFFVILKARCHSFMLHVFVRRGLVPLPLSFLAVICDFCEFGCFSLETHVLYTKYPRKKKKASLTLNFLQGRWLTVSLITVESWNAADSQPNYLESP